MARKSRRLSGTAKAERALIQDVPPPAWHLPSDDVFASQLDPEKPDLEFLRHHFVQEGRLTEKQALLILTRGTEVLKSEPNMLELPAPINVCGDIHGQYYDLMKLLEVGGPPGKNRYLFLGDYVDRGYFSIECFLYLLACKIWYPDMVFMLRGNHECKHLVSHFTFKMECTFVLMLGKHKYNDAVFAACLEAFNALPLAAVVNKQFFCVHGGLSPELSSLDDVAKINRFREPPSSGLMCDLLWSDPVENFGSETRSDFFTHNRARGCSFSYSYNAVCAFLEKNRFLSVIRAHEAQDSGYRMYKKTKAGFPSVITMFSAPNYLDVYNNKGAILKYDGQVFNIRQFSHSPHPYWLPNFMDVFTWSVPFVGEKVTEILLSILDFSARSDKLDDKLSEAEKDELEKDKLHRKEIVKNKIQAVGKMAKLFKILREERETIVELKNTLGKEELPPGTLALGVEEIKKSNSALTLAIKSFDDAKQFDSENEHLPPNLADEPQGLTMLTSPSLTSVASDSSIEL